MKLIDADALKYKNLAEVNGRLTYVLTPEEINNAPTVETSKIEHKAYNEGFKDGVDQGIRLSDRPQGKWILCEDTYFSKCSICGDIWLNEECGNYCSNCGAKMKGGAE